MKKFFSIVYFVLFAAFAIWFVASWVDVVSDNCNPNPTHSEYNLFVMLTEESEEK